MGFGEPKMPTPEEMAKIQKERALSDAELLKGGAEYVQDESGNSRLEVTRRQAKNIENQHIESLTHDDLPEGEYFLVNAIVSSRLIEKIVSSSKIDWETKTQIERNLEIVLNSLKGVSENLNESKTRGFDDLKRIAYDELKGISQRKNESNE